MPLLVPRQAYRPIEYPWAQDAFMKQNQAHWIATEVPMNDDVVDYRKKLSDVERNLITQVLRFFVTSDQEVQNNYQTRLMPVFQVPEVAMMLAAFAATEGIHVHAYSYLIDSLGLPESEYSAFLNYASMRAKYDYLHGFKNDTLHDLAKTIAVFGAFMEGTALFASFAILMRFKCNGTLRGLGQIIEWSQRDEQLHADSICMLYRTLLIEHPELATQRLMDEVHTACTTMVELEDAFIDTCFELGPIRGLTADEVKTYIRYVADKRRADVLLEPIYGIPEHPLKWLEAELTARTFVNFFENRATDYSKGAVDDSWPA